MGSELAANGNKEVARKFFAQITELPYHIDFQWENLVTFMHTAIGLRENHREISENILVVGLDKILSIDSASQKIRWLLKIAREWGDAGIIDVFHLILSEAVKITLTINDLSNQFYFLKEESQVYLDFGELVLSLKTLQLIPESLLQKKALWNFYNGLNNQYTEKRLIQDTQETTYQLAYKATEFIKNPLLRTKIVCKLASMQVHKNPGKALEVILDLEKEFLANPVYKQYGTGAYCLFNEELMTNHEIMEYWEISICLENIIPYLKRQYAVYLAERCEWQLSIRTLL